MVFFHLSMGKAAPLGLQFIIKKRFFLSNCYKPAKSRIKKSTISLDLVQNGLPLQSESDKLHTKEKRYGISKRSFPETAEQLSVCRYSQEGECL
jgi:hypothetical protein